MQMISARTNSKRARRQSHKNGDTREPTQQTLLTRKAREPLSQICSPAKRESWPPAKAGGLRGALRTSRTRACVPKHTCHPREGGGPAATSETTVSKKAKGEALTEHLAGTDGGQNVAKICSNLDIVILCHADDRHVAERHRNSMHRNHQSLATAIGTDG
jgi:hypothetical protein